MKEENYDKWLEAKSEVEHFDDGILGYNKSYPDSYWIAIG